MTLPTSKFGPVLYDPDRLAELPRRHISMSGEAPQMRLSAKDTGIDGQYQAYKRDDEHRLALARMRTNTSKSESARVRPWKYDQKRVGETVFGRSEGIYNATKNVFIPQNQYQDSALQGGVLDTVAGQTFKAKRLQGRIQELNTRDSIAKPLVAMIPTNSKVSQVEYTPPATLVEVEGSLNDLMSAISSNNYSGVTLEAASRFYRVVQKEGVNLDSTTLVRIMRVVADHIQQVIATMKLVATSPAGGLSAERFRVAENTLITLFKTYKLIALLITVSELSLKERRLALPGLIRKSTGWTESVATSPSQAVREKKVEFYDQVLQGMGAPDSESDEDSEEEHGGSYKKKVRG